STSSGHSIAANRGGRPLAALPGELICSGFPWFDARADFRYSTCDLRIAARRSARWRTSAGFLCCLQGIPSRVTTLEGSMRLHQMAAVGALCLAAGLVAAAESDALKMLIGIWEL